MHEHEGVQRDEDGAGHLGNLGASGGEVGQRREDRDQSARGQIVERFQDEAGRPALVSSENGRQRSYEISEYRCTYTEQHQGADDER